MCMHACIYVCTIFDILLAEEEENWTFPQFGDGEESNIPTWMKFMLQNSLKIL